MHGQVSPLLTSLSDADMCITASNISDDVVHAMPDPLERHRTNAQTKRTTLCKSAQPSRTTLCHEHGHAPAAPHPPPVAQPCPWLQSAQALSHNACLCHIGHSITAIQCCAQPIAQMEGLWCQPCFLCRAAPTASGPLQSLPPPPAPSRPRCRPSPAASGCPARRGRSWAARTRPGWRAAPLP